MEALIGIMLLVLGAIVFLFFKFSADEVRQQKNIEDAKVRRISDLEAESARKDIELKKIMEERQKLEDELYKSKDQTDIYKKENSEFLAKIKALEKSKDESSEAKQELKQKDQLLQQETVARQKLQAEVALKESEIEKLNKELDSLRQELKSKSQMLDGLKGQYTELENEIQKLREESLKKQEAMLKAETQQSQKPEVKPASLTEIKPEVKVEVNPEQPKPEVKQDIKTVAKPEAKPEQKQETKPEVAKPQEIPGFPKQGETKLEIKKNVPSDTDFLKAELSNNKDADIASSVSDGAFKFTNINKPSSQTQEKKPTEAPQKAPEKDKNKSKREVLIEGFHPKPASHPDEQKPE